jgi:hypothetical protein
MTTLRTMRWSPFAILLAGCASSNGAIPGGAGAGDGTTGTVREPLPCDVDAVLAASCRSCHGATPAYGAPMSLVTYGDLTAPSPSDASKKTYQAVAARIHDDAHAMPPTPNARLTASAASVLDAWAAAGAPKPSASASCSGGSTGGTPGSGGGRDAGADGGGGGGTGGVDPGALPCTPDTFIRPSSPYTIAPSSEEYVCFGVDVTTASKRHVIALSQEIDNKAVVHHLLVYKVAKSVSSTPKACSLGGPQGELVTGWAPGVGNLILPAEAGFPEEGTTHWVVQIHYNNVTGKAAQKDSTGYKLCTTDQLRPNDAGILAFGSTSFTIPPRGTLEQTCDYTFPGSTIHAFTAQSHMHLRGRSMSTLNTTTSDTIVDTPNFDFQTQDLHMVNFDIHKGDVIRNRCGWANETDKPVTFGQTTEDEMCFDFVSYWPRITTAGWSWMVPSARGTCK